MQALSVRIHTTARSMVTWLDDALPQVIQDKAISQKLESLLEPLW